PPPVPSQAYGGGAFDWCPDGSALVYAGMDGGLWRQSVTGGPPEQLVAGPGPVAAPAVAPDGMRVAYVVDTRDIAVASTSPDGPLEHGGATWGPGERSWCWSPDGGAVAYTRNEDGFGSLHVRDLRTGADRRVGRAVHGALSWVDGRIAAIRSGGITPTAIVVY